MTVHNHDSWKLFFNQFLCEYHSLPESRRRQLIFRGQADSRWHIEASLDRQRKFATLDERKTCLDRLIGEFRRQARMIDPTLALEPRDWELLGRHHGLPTTVLDFSASPYIASWFAFADASPAGASHVSIWLLDREVFATHGVTDIEIVDNEEAIRFNPRAQIQQGLFVRVANTAAGTLEHLLGDALARHDIRVTERQFVLGMLEEMTITARTMYSDLGAAAEAATTRVLVIGET